MNETGGKIMNKRMLHTAALMLAGCMLLGTAAGCKRSSPAAGSASAGTAQSTSYPLNTNVTLTYWCVLNNNVSPNYKSLGDTPYAKELEKETGVKIKYEHPASGQGPTEFNLLVSSGNMPDMIEYDWSAFPGGPEAAIDNKIILNLNDYFSKYAPDAEKLSKSKPAVSKMYKTDSGKYFGFPEMYEDPSMCVSYGLAVRKDWLQSLNLSTPETMDDWYNTLKAFKEKKGAALPFSFDGSGASFYPFQNGIFTGAYGLSMGYYVDSGKVKYGPYQTAYKDWLTEMNKWFKEGLIDPNFATNTTKALDANVISGKTGAVTLWGGSGMSKYLPSLKAKDSNADLVAVPYPVLKKGEKAQFGYMTRQVTGTVAITTSCKHPDIAAKFLNYGYTAQGSKLYNFGIEGTSYTMQNNTPKMTDEVLKNSKGLSIGQAWASYARGVYGGPYVQSKEYLNQYYQYQEQKDALTTWSNTNMAAHLMPPVTPTSDESSQYAKIMTDIDSYVQEYTLKAIMGTQSLSTFSDFQSKLKSMDIDKAITIEQNALNRYNKR